MNFTGKRAILYCRVSTDEQADRGYSIRDQQDRLHGFCQMMQITIIEVFQDDFSARTFDRPGWQKMMAFTRKSKGAANLLLFTNWSRFSRAENMGATYIMIDNLMKLGLEPQAIEQPLDLNIPENRLVLAFYIASPMVENLRRASNTANGIHRSLTEGRWCNKAPWGYRNTRDEDNKPLLAPDEARAPVIRQVFLDYLDNMPTADILRRARSAGLTPTGKSTLRRIITNPLYGGLVRVTAWRGEAEYLKPGIHEGIIPESLWYSANDKLERETEPKPRLMNEDLFLRGIARCDSCGSLLTGSRSRGKTGRHWWYYRCLRCKGQNIAATLAHENLHHLLDGISLKPDIVDDLLRETEAGLKEAMKQQQVELAGLKTRLHSLNENLESLERKYIANQVAFSTYEKHYPAFRREIANLTDRITFLGDEKQGRLDLFREALPRMTNIAYLWDQCTLESKQELLRLLFPGGLIMTRTGYRTPRLLSIFHLTTDKPSGYGEGKDDGKDVFVGSSLFGTEIEPLLRFIVRIAA